MISGNLMTNAEKFLAILRKIYDNNPCAFKGILPYRPNNSRRIIIGLDRQEMVSSVRSTSTSIIPQEVLNTDCWAQTNNSTPQKKEYLREIMVRLEWCEPNIEKTMKLWENL